MPQEHHVLRCFSCEVFQVHIVKKEKKWQCKMCGAKQSLKRNYGKGSGKDCRVQVMKLNELRLSQSDAIGQVENESFNEALTNKLTKQGRNENKPSISKWTEYLDEIEPEEDEPVENDTEIVREIGKKHKRPLQETFKRTKLHIEESNDSFSEVNSSFKEVQNVEGDKSFEKNANLEVQLGRAEMKKSKYSKYLDEDESESNIDLLENVNIRSNIFESEPADLDDLLAFNFV